MKRVVLLGLFLLVLLPSVSSAQSVQCSCVVGLRELWGINIHGDASKIVPNLFPGYQGQIVGVGDVILFDYNGVGHVALIMKVTRTGFMVVEYNFKRCQQTIREVQYTDSAIRGYLWVG